MSVPEYHEAVFRWPHPGANDVVVTGDFDAWSCQRHLSRTDSGKFEGKVQVPWGCKVAYKYIVDGRWTTTDDQPTEWSPQGFVNNVYNAPARPATPEPPAPEPEPVAEPQATSVVSNVVTAVKDTAVAMVAAIAPGTTEAPEPTPATATDVEATEFVEPETQDSVPEPVAQVAPEEPTPHDEIAAEAVLPQPAEQIEAAPTVPVPVLPLTTEKDTQLDTTIVEGSATKEPEAAVEPSTHTPVDPSATNGHAEKVPETTVVDGSVTSEPTAASEPSTHTPVPTTPETITSNGTLVEPSTHTPAAPVDKVAEPAAVNGQEVKPETVALPPPTPAEVPLPATPAANGNGKATPQEPSSNTTSPGTSPRKEHKRTFPSFSKHRRSSSIASTSTHGADEHGVANGNGTAANGHRKKRTSSIFGKIREIFSDSNHHKTHA